MNNKKIDIVPSYPKYPTNSFENINHDKLLPNNTLEVSDVSEPPPILNKSVKSSDFNEPKIVENGAVSFFKLSYIEYLGIIGICVFIIFIITELQNEYQDQTKKYLIKSNVKQPTISEIIENMKTNFIDNISSFFTNSIEYLKMKYDELHFQFNKWLVNYHLENKMIKTTDISYYKDKDK